MSTTVQLAMWGPSSAGKTMLLAQLYNQWSTESGWDVMTTELGQVFIDAMRDWVDARNLFPPPTDPQKPQEVVYEFVHLGSDRRATLSIEDRAGVDSETLPDDAMERLNSAHGLILLFDPARRGSNIGREVIQTLEKLHLRSGRGTRADTRPVAICLSKTDQLIHTASDLRRAREEPDAFVRQWIGSHLSSEVLAKIDTYSDNHRFFPLSSVGLVEHHGLIDRVVFVDEYLDERIARGGEPLNLEAPFVWMFEQLGGE